MPHRPEIALPGLFACCNLQLPSEADIATIYPSIPKAASGAVQIAAATIGNALEWFDLLVYGYFATTIASVFFPSTNQLVSLLLTFGSFGLSYVARPLGAVLLGAYADRAGRRAALTLSIWLMVAGTAVMALMPSYAAIGVAAPIAVFLARLLQGFAVAGEFGSSTAFMIEHSAHRKAFYSSWQFAGQNIAKLLAALFGLGLFTQLSGHQLEQWGWRVPFFFGMSVGPVGIYIRRKLNETPEFLNTITTRTPLREILQTEKVAVLLGVGMIAVGTANTYFSIYIPTYASRMLHLPASTGYMVTIVLSVAGIVLSPVFGGLADRFGVQRLLLPSATLMLVSFYPVFVMITRHPSMLTLMAGLVWDQILLSAYTAGLTVVLAGLFPARTRVTGLSLSYNVGVTLFGGFAPAIFTWLTAVTHNNAAPSYYLVATAVVSIAALIGVARRGSNYGSAKATT